MLPGPALDIGTVLRTRMKDGMMDYVAEHPGCIPELVSLALSGDKTLGWRAAWLLADTMEPNDSRVQPFAQQLMQHIPDCRDGHQRELIKVLLKLELDEETLGAFFDLAVTLWEDTSKAPAVRYYAFAAMRKTAERYPELTHEITALAAFPYVQTLSPGIRGSILQQVAELTGKGVRKRRVAGAKK
jgi:hypothetical protein